MASKSLHGIGGLSPLCMNGHTLFRQNMINNVQWSRRCCLEQMKCESCRTYIDKPKDAYFCKQCNYHLCSWCYQRQSVDIKNEGIGVIKYQCGEQQYTKMNHVNIRTIFDKYAIRLRKNTKEPETKFSPWKYVNYNPVLPTFEEFKQNLHIITEMELNQSSLSAIKLIIKILETETENKIYNQYLYDQYNPTSDLKCINYERLQRKLRKMVQDDYIYFISLLTMVGFQIHHKGNFVAYRERRSRLQMQFYHAYHELKVHIDEGCKIEMEKYDKDKDELLRNISYFIVQKYCGDYVDKLGLDIAKFIDECCGLEVRYLVHLPNDEYNVDKLNDDGIKCLLQSKKIIEKGGCIDYILVVKLRNDRYIYRGYKSDIYYNFWPQHHYDGMP